MCCTVGLELLLLLWDFPNFFKLLLFFLLLCVRHLTLLLHSACRLMILDKTSICCFIHSKYFLPITIANSKRLSKLFTMQTSCLFPSHTIHQLPFSHTERPHLHSSLRNHNHCSYIIQEDAHYLVKLLAGCTNSSTQELRSVCVFNLGKFLHVHYQHTQAHRQPEQRL